MGVDEESIRKCYAWQKLIYGPKYDFECAARYFCDVGKLSVGTYIHNYKMHIGEGVKVLAPVEGMDYDRAVKILNAYDEWVKEGNMPKFFQDYPYLSTVGHEINLAARIYNDANLIREVA